MNCLTAFYASMDDEPADGGGELPQRWYCSGECRFSDQGHIIMQCHQQQQAQRRHEHRQDHEMRLSHPHPGRPSPNAVPPSSLGGGDVEMSM